MKTYHWPNFLLPLLLFTFLNIVFSTACKEDLEFFKRGPKNNDTKKYPADVAREWLTLHVVKLTRTTPGYNSLVSNRSFAYTGLALYESVVPGMNGYHSLSSQLTEMPDMPGVDKKKDYHWPASANAALASISRSLFPHTTAANHTTIDSLEMAYNERYQQEVDIETFNRSVAFGKQVAAAIFDWSKTDGGHEAYLRNTDDSYIPPTGKGLWVSTPPAFAKPLQPHWGNNRPFIEGIVAMTQPAAPMAYSEVAASPFYAAAEELYSISQGLTDEQTTIAKYWNDSPVTFNVPGHATHILTQILSMRKVHLAGAALAYAQHGIALNDASISCFKAKYRYHLIRPVSYIPMVMNQTNWSPLVNTPPHPEYPSAHATLSGASAEVMRSLFGDKYTFTDNSYKSVFGARTYKSFAAYAQEASISRIYGGIHYRFSCDIGLDQGKKVGQAVTQLNFK